MRLIDFDYELPPERIAQHPSERRDGARLLVLDDGEATVADLPGFLRPGDLVVLNDTRVFPARLIGRKATGGRIELLLLARRPGPEPALAQARGALQGNGAETSLRQAAGEELWRCMMGASRMPIASARIEIESPDPELKFTARVISPPKDGEALVALSATRTGASGTAPVPVTDAIERCGTIPLPPYIRRPDRDPRAGEAPATDDAADRERYQTVFAKESGAAAAPTAGLHFTPGLFDALRARGVSTATLTLHVGLGTFQPVRLEDQDDISRHRIHSELYRIPIETRREIAALRKRGGRLIAIGTTVVRALEHAALSAETDHETGPAIESSCDLFITPGFRFREVDLLLTNFHLPKSTLLMLVSAFCGRERLLGAYRDAIARGYRFYSYGDAMLISRSNAEPGAERGPGSDSGGSR